MIINAQIAGIKRKINILLSRLSGFLSVQSVKKEPLSGRLQERASF